MNRQRVFYFAISAAALAITACNSSPDADSDKKCITRYDCAENEFCRDGECVVRSDDPWLIPERKFGETCISTRECIDGVCLPIGPDNGGTCTHACKTAGDCEEGYSCRTWTGSEKVEPERVCVQDTSLRLCLPCAVDGHCNAVGDLCIDTKDGKVCSQDCSIDECPTGYSCDEYVRDEATFSQCVPIGNTCECGEGKVGMRRACTNENEYGVCSGWSTCQYKANIYNWTECDAQTPAMELCNGIDDDCDGLTDGDDPSLKLETDSEEDMAKYPICYLGGCIGRWQCSADDAGKYGWRCDAGDPERELCNGRDDNCNGEIDEMFVDSAGRYVHVDNCGACGASCSSIVSHLSKDSEGNVEEGAVKCEVRGDAPVCVPLKCEKGYYPYPHEAPVSCVKLESPACQVCVDDNDCRVYSDVCRPLGGDFGKHCLQSCSVESPYEGCSGLVDVQSCCPDGYTCRLYDGAKLCIPKGETCSCNDDKVDSVRNCVLTSDTGICQGRQTCEKLGTEIYSWSQCRTDDMTQELCDGQDNNCDGEIDEGYRDKEGRYNHPKHCGECNSDCESRWKAPELHAEGACLPERDNYSCQFTGCKTEEHVLGNQCHSDADCATGQKCDRQMYYCVMPGSEMPGVSCTADKDCSGLGSERRCIDGVCKIRVQFFDLNGIDADGCECGATVDGTDEPDMFGTYPSENDTYVDRNCDGIDGTEATSLFVNADTDASFGTRAHPYKTIGEAVAAYDPRRHTAILVAAGTYLEQVKMTSGVRLYGGYNSDFSRRNIVLNPTQIMAPPPSADGVPGTVYIPDAARRTSISGFAIYGYDADDSEAKPGQPGHNTYAVYIEKGRSNVVLSDNMIIAGRAGDGGRGLSGDTGYAGLDGGRGRDSRECDDRQCYGQLTSGGTAGRNEYCRAADGRPGADAQGGEVRQDYDPVYKDPRDGQGGTNNRYDHNKPEHMSYCKYDCLSGGYSHGADGRNGENGAHGVGGNGCFNVTGDIRNNKWHGKTAGTGGSGGAASGGGGGGAGGSSVNDDMGQCTEGRPVGDVGGSGGGGGAGGCGGSGGTGGGSGGGSFGIWIAETVTKTAIYGNVIRLGRGGNGGAGGDGGAGGIGGKGGMGGANHAPAWCAGAGGSGGGGGNGGAGGGGGGGCGGIAGGIAGLGIDTHYADANAFESNDDTRLNAAGGKGGDSPAGEMGKGRDGRNGISEFLFNF